MNLYLRTHLLLIKMPYLWQMFLGVLWVFNCLMFYFYIPFVFLFYRQIIYLEQMLLHFLYCHICCILLLLSNIFVFYLWYFWSPLYTFLCFLSCISVFCSLLWSPDFQCLCKSFSCLLIMSPSVIIIFSSIVCIEDVKNKTENSKTLDSLNAACYL